MKIKEKKGFALAGVYDLVSEYVKEKGILADALLCDGRAMFPLLCEALAV